MTATSLQLRWLQRRGTYFDSLRLMEIHAWVLTQPGVVDGACVMATDSNQELLAARGLLPPGIRGGPDDLLVVLQGEDPALLETALRTTEESLQRHEPGDALTSPRTTNPRTLDGALQQLAGANVALISVPGAYAAAEATRALLRGLHVLVFSDNVAIEDEIALKQLAHERGLLLMGPDCGTAILNGAPLGFANVVRRGPVGIVGASGTGIQQASVLLDRLGLGVSHAIGVGGRDLTAAVDGRMTLDALDALDHDPATKVILLISKPPATETVGRVVDHLRALVTPVVVCFLGADPAMLDGVEHGQTIEEAVVMAARHINSDSRSIEPDGMNLRSLVDSERRRLRPTQTRVCGLYVGGTLAYEAEALLNGVDHTVVDLRDDQFTLGRPHPMIDPSLRGQRLEREVMDPRLAVLLCDVVLGLGAHPDPSGALSAALRRATVRVEAAGTHAVPAVVASVCGTSADPQGLEIQERILRAAGIAVFPTNAQAAAAAATIATRGKFHPAVA